MKTYFLAFSCLLGAILPLAAARSADADSLGADSAKDCSARADEFRNLDRTAANYTKRLEPTTFLKIKHREPIPVFASARHALGPNDATLIILINQKQGASVETPDIYAVCIDTNHEFQNTAPRDYISFESDDVEHLYLRFRLDLKSLPHTSWKMVAGDSVQMKEIKPPPFPVHLPSPTGSDWCGPLKDKDVTVHGKDMYFTMCKHYGKSRYYKYSLHMDVNGKDYPIDPLIIHQPQ